MLKSMTGYGKAVVNSKDKEITVEIKSLNSKAFDFNSKIPTLFKEKENEIKTLVLNTIKRGKIDFQVHIEYTGENIPASINKNIVKSLFNQFKEIAEELGFEAGEQTFQSIIRMPDVMQSTNEELSEEDYKLLIEGVNLALKKIDEFRIQEGKITQIDLENHIKNITNLLQDVEKYESKRVEKIKDRLNNNLEEFIEESKIDRNRFEQEMIYYLEKYDISEEKVRLANHCKYFLETIESESPQGKKLGFISQEIGREINTLGSKANDSDIQKLVIRMKDELEKIKEQTLNIL